MIDLDAGFQLRGFDLDEIADPRTFAKRCARPQARIGSDGGVSADRGLHDVAEGMDHRAVGDADAGADHHERLDGDVAAEFGVGGKKDGVWLDVEKKIADYKQIAKKLQNRDGTFSTKYFDPEEPDPVPNAAIDKTELRISTSGHVLEWLALAMTDDELRSPWMQNAVNGLVILILEMGPRSIDGGALYHAAHGLHLYHERVFGTPAAYLPLPPRR